MEAVSITPTDSRLERALVTSSSHLRRALVLRAELLLVHRERSLDALPRFLEARRRRHAHVFLLERFVVAEEAHDLVHAKRREIVEGAHTFEHGIADHDGDDFVVDLTLID